ncbi:MAG: type II toxin-antitoxin system PemK/MazF family toxin [Oscillospiraceae bacterium]|jgi:mRNA-degrading endonuclease toxin of MazEF toxin-antitoxin module|nr:type II toxin-antitoxin system PemK/MazF family toxin [Oscillospiraceae bacterium]
MANIKDVGNSLNNCKNALQSYFNDVSTAEPLDENALKLSGEHFKWVELKTNLIRSESSFALPKSALPNKVGDYVYNYLFQEKKDIIDKYYKKDADVGERLISVSKEAIPQAEADTLINNLVLRRGNVVWVNFGVNIGREFGGKHPALILKNTKDTLIALPLSSQPPRNPDINVQIDNVYGLPLKPRWGNILRIVPVSVIRIDFNSPIGSVKNDVLKEVGNKVRNYGIK